MELHGTPWNSMDLHGIPWNSMEFYGIPWNSMEFYGVILHGLRLMSKSFCSIKKSFPRSGQFVPQNIQTSSKLISREPFCLMKIPL